MQYDYKMSLKEIRQTLEEAKDLCLLARREADLSFLLKQEVTELEMQVSALRKEFLRRGFRL